MEAYEALEIDIIVFGNGDDIATDDTAGNDPFSQSTETTLPFVPNTENNG